ncbi:serine hydrolase domain-containing protein [Brumicola nitratireducens]|uniref:Beta-lactamase n=1 Tax=Glaciecola nitratireducens (strain JCM 12485 / KCTC 12276 / FR1064) TaxID=1085623 RepID=G4QIM6_GLANF|nr:serine hydrolase domain-containing protein [Glaciecola nitratireducens]AEP31181.1 beta-lactamase [Glaciecola nitratireducens FR1064]
MKKILVVLLSMSLTACVVSVNENSGHAQQESSTSQAIGTKQGFSEQRLLRINSKMQEYIDEGKLAGIMTLVSRNNQTVHFAAQGMQDKDAGIPLRRDTIFRIYSMTKPITTVAALTLWEQGKFHMNDPISMYLPELANLKVYVSGSGENMVLEDAKYPIRIIDLFTHTAGFSYGFSGSEVDKLYRASPMMQGKTKPENVLAELAKLPLNHQPGTQWNYGVSTDVIGFLVEKLSNMKLGEYVKQEILTPLNMQDTGFYVPAEKAQRFSKVYNNNKEGKTAVMENEPLGDFLSDPAVHNGGGGMVSTIDDFLIFARMLLNNGEVNGVRILGRKTVEYMRSNHLPAELLPYRNSAAGEGYGLAMSVTMNTDDVKFMSSEGNFGWSGAASTYFRIDPVENLIIIGMAQFIPVGTHPYSDDLRNLTYQALVDEK